MALTAMAPSPADLQGFLGSCQLRRYRRGDVIIAAGDKPTTLYCLVKGTVSVSVAEELEDEKEVIVAYLGPGDFFGEMGLFDPGQFRSASCRARTDCEIAEMSYRRFSEYALAHPAILFTLGKQMASRLRNTTRKVGDLAFYDVTGRVARALIELSQQPDALTHPDGMQVKISRLELGRLVNCSREMAGRVLKALEEQDLISVHGQTIVVRRIS